MATTRQAVPARHEVPLAERWDLESVFPTDDAWDAAFRAAEGRLPELDAYRGRLAESAATLLAALRLRDEIGEQAQRVLVYALLRRSEDATNAVAAGQSDRAQGLGARAAAAGAFFEPEIAALPDETATAWLAAEPGLAPYRYALDRVRRRKEHIRSAEVEETLARAGEVFASIETIHDVLENGELPLGTVRDEAGAEVALAQGNLERFLHSPERRVRREAWERSADAYLAYKGTFAAGLAGAVKRDAFYAKAHGYPSSLEAALAPDAIPPRVFHTLLDTIWANFPTWHRYFRVRRRLLGLSEGDFHGYDLEAPLVAEPAMPWDRGVDLITGSLAPLGDEYVGAVTRGIADRWVDRAANVGKGGGAFSWGSYGTHPFISMTYQDDLSSVSTLTHEIGHSLHSYLTWRHQPVTYANYGMSAAETASNFNQQLLGAHLLGMDDERDWTIAVVEERMANHLRYLFIMPILARFELWCHEKVERGEALTADGMSQHLLSLYREGYGSEVVLDGPDAARVGITWARFPHLYANFYVFQYALGISAAAALAAQVREDGEPAAARYLAFLRAGGSLDPIDALREAGVDMASPAPIQRAFDLLAGYVDRLEAFAG
ncbi:MAG: Oligoendopeptidase F [uncultured Thermomicrobiales bacterium]|uniref:Oligopeptidase F n=1 Tax=uncultured Thermomicrobiales bacterium TaxID=1645740 RepID=A0A6J4V2M3_9BACT|nr:MAG: Oligoendopeptidase F [uncultured Thermomicrobiales bacterium]